MLTTFFKWGDNSKCSQLSLSGGTSFSDLFAAAIMRIGLVEMKRFSQEFFDVKTETILEHVIALPSLVIMNES